MSFIDNLKSKLSKKKNNDIDDDLLDDDMIDEDILEDDEDDLDMSDEDILEDDLDEDFEESKSNKKSKINLTPEKKKKIAIGVAASIVIVAGSIFVPNIISGGIDEFETSQATQEIQNIQKTAQEQNNKIKEKVQKKTPPPKRENVVNKVDTQQKEKEEEISVDLNNGDIDIDEVALNSELDKINSDISDSKNIEIEKVKTASINQKLINTKKISASKDINNNNTEEFLNKINTNSKLTENLINNSVIKNTTTSMNEQTSNIDPFLLESSTIVDNSYHKKVMISQIDMMKEFMDYLDIKKQFDDAVEEYKNGKVSKKTIQEKIEEEMKNLQINKKIMKLEQNLEKLNNENKFLKITLKEKMSTIDKITNDFNDKVQEVKNINQYTSPDISLRKTLDSITVEELNVYTISNKPIAEISVDGSLNTYSEGDKFKGFRIKDINNDGIILSFIDANGVERTKNIYKTSITNEVESFKTLKIPTSTKFSVQVEEKANSNARNRMKEKEISNNNKNNNNNNEAKSNSNNKKNRFLNSIRRINN